MTLALLLLAGCALQDSCAPTPAPQPPPPLPASPPRFQLVEGSAVTQVGGLALSETPFDQLAMDLDLDGDEDLLINRHLNNLLLLENQDGALRPRDRRDTSAGITVPPGVRSLYGGRARLKTHSEDGVVLYQVYGTGAVFDLALQTPATGAAPSAVRLSLSSPLSTEDETAIQRVSDREVLVRLPPRGQQKLVRLTTRDNTPRVDLVQLDARGQTVEQPLPWFVGGQLDRFEGPTLSFWVPDPHGMALAPLLGGQRPDLVVARGGNIGKLNLSQERKEHSLYRALPTEGPTFEAIHGRIPPDSGRARSVEWVDIDNDQKNELYIANMDGPPALLIWNEVEQRFEDRAAPHGLADVCGESSAWLDHDDDGWQDLVVLCGSTVKVWQNVGAGAFVSSILAELSLVEASKEPDPHGWIRETSIQVLDLNGDDRLDLWLVGVGGDRGHRVLLGGPQGYREASAELGLAGSTGAREARLFDADMDGWPDLFVAAEASHLLWNRPSAAGGRTFERIELATLIEGAELDRTKTRLQPFRASATAPRDDLLVSGRSWMVARNVTSGEASLRRVDLSRPDRAPAVGALVRAVYADGHVQRVRYGSHARTLLSQALPDVRFGSPAPGSITRIEIRWPESNEWVALP